MAHRYTSQVLWTRGEQSFLDQRYSRRHALRFDGGIEVAASSSPQVVPLPYSDAAAIDPEEAFVASLSSCHLLWFLSLAAGAGYVVDEYRDDAEGFMRRDERGRMMIARVVLHPQLRFAAGHAPTVGTHERLHHRAHDECFIANSVRTEVRCEPVILG